MALEEDRPTIDPRIQDLNKEVSFLCAVIKAACAEGHLTTQGLSFVLGKAVRDQVGSRVIDQSSADAFRNRVLTMGKRG